MIGAGAWGTAVAVHAAGQHEVMLWARDAALAGTLRSGRSNPRYLPGVELPTAIDATADLDRVCGWLGDGPDSLAVVATSVAGLRPVLAALAGRLHPGIAGLVWLCKGIERDTGALPHRVAAELMPGYGHGVLSGPSFAQEVAAGLPVALTVASRVDLLRIAAPQVALAEPQEKALAQRLLAYPTAVAETAAAFAPHRLCTYLFDLAQDFTAFYEHCPVARADEPVRSSRLALCDVTARTLASGLSLLGIDAPEAM